MFKPWEEELQVFRRMGGCRVEIEARPGVGREST